MAKITYQSAGVDLDSYREAMARLPRLMRRTFSPRVIPQEGGFAGLFRLDFAGRLFARDYREPVLVACTDGVGTKLKIAQATGCHDTIGIDLVAMCVNDAICNGAEPLFFLDYVAMGRDDPPRLEALVQGISDGCLEAGCALLGGETAIMPDVYGADDYDLAGFCVGVVEQRHLINGRSITEGDAVIGVASSGLHANGYSLVRKIVFDAAGLDVHEKIPHLDRTVAQVLLEPTCIYARAVHRVLGHYRVKNVVHGIAHVTGGGLCENVQRVVPREVNVVIKPGSWHVPEVFAWLQRLGDIDTAEMNRVFNLGVGLVLVVSAFHANQILSLIKQCGHDAWLIGRVTEGQGRVYCEED